MNTINVFKKFSLIKVGDTYNISSGEIVIHRSWYGWYTRFTSGENHLKLYKWMYELYSSRIDDIKSNYTLEKKDLAEFIIASRPGIHNLDLTYTNYQDVDFSSIVQEIDCFNCHYHNTYCDRCNCVHYISS